MKRPLVKRRNRFAQTKPQLELSAMVDVVFLLLIFFIVTLKVDDIFAELNVSAPTPSKHPPIEISLFKIHITENGYMVNGKSLSEESLAATLKKLAHYSPRQQLTVICDSNSYHAQLVTALDICAREGMENIVLMHQ